MMFLTRARLATGSGPAGSIAAQLAESSHKDQAHALIWSLMAKDTRDRDFLYRQTDSAPPSFLILSARKPEKLYDFWQLETQDFAPNLPAGSRFFFSLRASPAIRKSRNAAKGAGQRVDIVMDAKIRAKAGGQTFDDPEEIRAVALDWLVPRAHARGFDIDKNSARVSGYRQIKTAEKDGKGFVRFSALDYDGVLTVNDPAAFLSALRSGIGPQKSYGCGLLLIKPADVL